jgi:hypothetical protein
MGRYALAEHVFVCLNGEHLVLLDLKEDRYWALEASQTAGLGAVVGGWPVGPAQDADTDSPETSAVIEVLRGRGILEEGGSHGKDATPVATVAAARELLVEGETSPGARLPVLTSFLLAAAFAKFVLRFWPFERVILRVRRRKAAQAAPSAPLDIERTRRLVEAFARYRVYLFTSKDECLHDSLALLEFLARYGIHPDWMFGVQTRPFAAHCWIQHGDIVFNDTVEHISGYTPIMVVSSP